MATSKKAIQWTFSKIAAMVLTVLVIIMIILALSSQAKGATSPIGRLGAAAKEAALKIPIVGQLLPKPCYSNANVDLAAGDNYKTCLWSPPGKYGSAGSSSFVISGAYSCPVNYVVSFVDFKTNFIAGDSFIIYSNDATDDEIKTSSVPHAFSADQETFADLASLSLRGAKFVVFVRGAATRNFEDNYGVIITNVYCSKPQVGSCPPDTPYLNCGSGGICACESAPACPASAPYVDFDGDGYGLQNGDATSIIGFDTRKNCAAKITDCDETDLHTYPGAAEVCDGKDNDCTTSTNYADAEKKVCAWQNSCGTFNNACKNDGTERCQTDANGDYYCADVSSPSLNCKIDSDGDSYCATLEADDGSTLPASVKDCNDNNRFVSPGAQEVCSNGVDDNCNTQIDEMPCANPWCVDNDGDGSDVYAITEAEMRTSHPCRQGFVPDCNDGDKTRGSGLPEICDDVDNNCNGQKDEGLSFFDYEAYNIGPDGTAPSADDTLYGSLPEDAKKNTGVCEVAGYNSYVTCFGGQWYWDYAKTAAQVGWVYETEEGKTNIVYCNDRHDNDCDSKADCGGLTSCSPVTWQAGSGEYNNGFCNSYCNDLATNDCQWKSQGQGQGGDDKYKSYRLACQSACSDALTAPDKAGFKSGNYGSYCQYDAYTGTSNDVLTKCWESPLSTSCTGTLPSGEKVGTYPQDCI